MRKIQEVEQSNQCIELSAIATQFEGFIIAQHGKHIPYNHAFRDQGWGCAWRAIQMVLSGNDIETDFEKLFQTYGRKERLIQVIENKKPKLLVEEIFNTQWTPEQNQHNWAEPFIGQLICEDFGLDSELILVNGLPNCYSPEIVFQSTIVFHDFFEKVKDSLPHQIIMIDDGKLALAIVGYRQDSPTQKQLLLADPHIFSNKKYKLAGIYSVTLNENGEQIEHSVTQEGKAAQYDSFGKIFFHDKKWMALFVKGKK